MLHALHQMLSTIAACNHSCHRSTADAMYASVQTERILVTTAHIFCRSCQGADACRDTSAPRMHIDQDSLELALCLICNLGCLCLSCSTSQVLPGAQLTRASSCCFSFKGCQIQASPILISFAHTHLLPQLQQPEQCRQEWEASQACQSV